ncbi:MAG: ankyrin repeat domain-containing protein, partial [Acidobacteria bacterium]|nr:ankyrin repeat domain-containing protein [Acidobacteriota bacterium]
IAALLEAGANLELRTDQGLTPLHVAVVFNKNPAIIAALLEAGANLEARTDRDWTPLHAATSSNENPVVVAALLDAGADPNARTKEGETARQLASDNEALSNTDVYWRLAHATEDDRAGPSGVSFFDRFDPDVILNIAAGVILAGVVLGVLYSSSGACSCSSPPTAKRRDHFSRVYLPSKYAFTAPRPASWALA